MGENEEPLVEGGPALMARSLVRAIDPCDNNLRGELQQSPLSELTSSVSRLEMLTTWRGEGGSRSS